MYTLCVMVYNTNFIIQHQLHQVAMVVVSIFFLWYMLWFTVLIPSTNCHAKVYNELSVVYTLVYGFAIDNVMFNAHVNNS